MVAGLGDCLLVRHRWGDNCPDAGNALRSKNGLDLGRGACIHYPRAQNVKKWKSRFKRQSVLYWCTMRPGLAGQKEEFPLGSLAAVVSKREETSLQEATLR